MSSLIPKPQPLPHEYYFAQMICALKHLHDRRVVHRDIKAENVFLTRDNFIKLGDFGISRTLESSIACAQTKIGTPYYLSPEICCDQPYNRKSDIWTLGVLLYYLCALRPPFDISKEQQAQKEYVFQKKMSIYKKTHSADLISNFISF